MNLDIKQAKRILIKVSGEFLMGEKPFGICQESLARVVHHLKSLLEQKQVALVVGGGNFFRGNSAPSTMNRRAADHVGMLSTVMNGIVLQDYLSQHGLRSIIYSAIEIPGICEKFYQEKAQEHMEKKEIPIFVAGTGNPFFSTDTAAILRAIEMKCDLMIKGTQVDGVYTEDPRHSTKAQRFDKISCAEILEKRLKVMDLTAVVLAAEHKLPIVVCSIHQPHSLINIFENNTTPFTLIHA